jgi:excisionase family DNA binding protein
VKTMAGTDSQLASGKVTAGHLKRKAYLYVRQSTLRQVLENCESTLRQYGLRTRAEALGWPPERIVVIDSDLGQSGATAVDRVGFQRLVAEVGLGHAGIVIGLEVSRLARSCTDWHRLLEICALTETLILDEDGLYDPSQFNDRLLLGLKGAMSEAELHVLKARLRGGIENKARRGELKQPLPTGFVYTPDGRVTLDPDQQVQTALHLLFNTFQRTGSALATVRTFRDQQLDFPGPIQSGPRAGEVSWGPLLHTRVISILKNPRYAGAFFFGRSKTRRGADGKSRFQMLPRDEWHTLIQNAHAGYITWLQFEQNLERLHDNAQAHGEDRRQSPPREGSALLQGLVICGVCGRRMAVGYHTRAGHSVPDYCCVKERVQRGARSCQYVPGEYVDKAIGSLLLEVVTPVALEVAIQVQQELLSRSAEVDNLRRQKVERARYEADLAQRRYLRVDPDNRLVATALEAEWNSALRALTEAQEDYEKQQGADLLVVTEAQRGDILALATNFPRLWQDPLTPDRERKRMVRLMLEDVTLTRTDRVLVQVRFKGGAQRVLEVPLPRPIGELRRTDASTVAEIDLLLEHHTDREIAAILDARGLQTGAGLPFRPLSVRTLRKAYGLADRYTRLRQRGLLTVSEVAEQLGVSTGTVAKWRRRGLLRAHAYGDEVYLIEPPDASLPRKHAHKKDHPRRATAMTANERRGAV